MRFFNTAGPVNSRDHYTLSPLSRVNIDEIISLIHQKKYFILHAPRQTGKTSCLLALMAHLNQMGEYSCLYINVEGAQAARENVSGAIGAIISEIKQRIKQYDLIPDTNNQVIDQLSDTNEFTLLNGYLTSLAQSTPHPFILLIDEIDALVGDSLISVLRQIRSGYDKRPDYFPSSVILCGVRDIRDYRIHSDSRKSVITGGSAFNIKAESLRLGNFSFEDITILFLQHTEETGQIFEKPVFKQVWDLTAGQPWLVNALGYEICFRMPEGKDRTRTITSDMVIQAKENLILRRETHLDQLTDKLKEERVRRVIEPILAGDSFESGFLSPDVEYVLDLGLIRQEQNGEIAIANRIYQEVIPRELSWNAQMGMALKQSWYLTPDNRLDTSSLLTAFQQFFREHQESWVDIFQYKEVAPQLLLMAFLQRVVNGGGRIDREYGLGRGRVDLYVAWPISPTKWQRVVIEMKIIRGSREKTIQDGITQVYRYADRCGADEAHLIVFDQTPGISWDEKIFRREEGYSGTPDYQCSFPVTVWGM
ncbi:MAG: AAA-like domain-containing protein [Methanobacteriota archaeon]